MDDGFRDFFFPVTLLRFIMILNKNCLSVPRHWSRHTPEGAALEAEWNAKFAEYEKKYKEEAAELKSIINGEFPAGWEKALPVSKLTNF